MSSSEAINYGLRINKSIERRLIAYALYNLNRKFPIKLYKYIGFASLWFSDFILFHKYLGITKMVSIECEEAIFNRQIFNRPFDCIKVIQGHSSACLPTEISPTKRCITWLDYDGNIEDLSSIVSDVEAFSAHSKSGSILLLTLNAHASILKREDASRLDIYNQLLGSFALAGTVDADLSVKFFPQTLAAALLSMLEYKVGNAGRGMQFHSIFNYCYSDGVAMITVGGMACNETDAKKFVRAKLNESHPSFCSDEQFNIKSPSLTKKEVAYLNSLLPDSLISNLTAPNPASKYAIIAGSDLLLPRKDVEAYERFYVQYPSFTEIHSD